MRVSSSVYIIEYNIIGKECTERAYTRSCCTGVVFSRCFFIRSFRPVYTIISHTRITYSWPVYFFYFIILFHIFRVHAFVYYCIMIKIKVKIIIQRPVNNTLRVYYIILYYYSVRDVCLPTGVTRHKVLTFASAGSARTCVKI